MSVKEHDHKAEWGDQPVIKFAPDHVISEATSVILLLALYTVLAIFIPGHLWRSHESLPSTSTPLDRSTGRPLLSGTRTFGGCPGAVAG